MAVGMMKVWCSIPFWSGTLDPTKYNAMDIHVVVVVQDRVLGISDTIDVASHMVSIPCCLRIPRQNSFSNCNKKFDSDKY